jgi:hypothetical protein
MPTPDEIAATRHGCKNGNGTPRRNPDDPLDEDRVGAMGELAFARAFGFEVDETPRPAGDGGIDFRFSINQKPVTIDVKTARMPRYLLVTKEGKCADLFVLAAFDRGAVFFLGWETAAVMRCMPTTTFSENGPTSHFRPASELRPMGQLVNLLATRDAPLEAAHPAQPETEKTP